MKVPRRCAGVSEIVGAILLISLVLAIGSVYALSSVISLSDVSGAIGGQMDQAIVRTKQLLDLEFYNKNETHTTLWLFPYGLAPIDVFCISTPSNRYDLKNATIIDAEGRTASRLLPGELYELTLPEDADWVEVTSTVGGVWRWETP